MNGLSWAGQLARINYRAEKQKILDYVCSGIFSANRTILSLPQCHYYSDIFLIFMSRTEDYCCSGATLLWLMHLMTQSDARRVQVQGKPNEVLLSFEFIVKGHATRGQKPPKPVQGYSQLYLFKKSPERSETLREHCE